MTRPRRGVEVLDGELAACRTALETPDCSADPAYVEAAARLVDARDQIAALEATLAEVEAKRDVALSEVAGLSADLETRRQELERVSTARDNAMKEFQAVNNDLATALGQLARAEAEIAGLGETIDALTAENARLAAEAGAARDIPRIQALLGSLTCAPRDVAVSPGVEIPVVATSDEEVLRIGEALAGIGPGFRVSVGLSETIPGAGCPSIISSGWSAVRWDGEPPEVRGSFVGSADARSMFDLLPEADRCRELAPELEGIGARFWVRNGLDLGLCDVGEGELDRTRNVQGAAAILLLPIEPVAVHGGG